jgi:hypothetical protein
MEKEVKPSMTKEQVNEEYRQAAGSVGERVYRLFVPFLELHQVLTRMLFLNQEAWRLEQASKKTEAEKIDGEQKETVAEVA